MTNVEHNPYQGSFISGQTVTRDAQGRVITLEEARVGHDTVTHTYGYNLRGELNADNERLPADIHLCLRRHRQPHPGLEQPGHLKQRLHNQQPQPVHRHHDHRGRRRSGHLYLRLRRRRQPDPNPHRHRRLAGNLQRRQPPHHLYTGQPADRKQIRLPGAPARKSPLPKRPVAKTPPLYLQRLPANCRPGHHKRRRPGSALHPALGSTEPEATRPLILIRPEDNGQNWYEYTHTLNKNIANLTDKTDFIVAHYDYDAYGNQIEQTGTLAEENPIRFSSEYFDEELGLIYYNYRHYNPKDGRWINRDPIEESGGMNLYGFVFNYPLDIDYLGLDSKTLYETKGKLYYRLDVETNGARGYSSLHIQTDKNSDPRNKYDYRTDKNVPGFYNRLTGKSLPQSVRKDLIKNKKEWDKYMKKAKDIIDRSNGLSPKFGGGKILGGICLFIYFADFATSCESYCTAMNSGDIAEMDEIYNDMIENMPDMGTMGKSELKEQTKDYHEKLKDFAGEIRRQSTEDELFYK